MRDIHELNDLSAIIGVVVGFMTAAVVLMGVFILKD